MVQAMDSIETPSMGAATHADKSKPATTRAAT
jgi:hypothetical protein